MTSVLSYFLVLYIKTVFDARTLFIPLHAQLTWSSQYTGFVQLSTMNPTVKIPCYWVGGKVYLLRS